MASKLIAVYRYFCFYLIYLLSKIIPFKRKIFLFISMSGNSFGGNPKAFYDYLKTENNRDFDCVWAFSSKQVSIYKTNSRKVKLYSFLYYYYLNVSKFIISDQRLFKQMMPKKHKRQCYIQMWHGTALKKIEADMPKLSSRYKKEAIRDSNNINYVLSNSQYMTKIFRNSFWYEGDILEYGTPRNDIFFDKTAILSAEKRVRDSFGLSEDLKIVLYAPTFRNKNSLLFYDIDLSGVKENLPGDNWIFLIRLHPNLLDKYSSEQIKKSFPNAIDTSSYSDIQDLLCAADVLITDYSSSMFDYIFMYKPCFIYAKDLNEYERGFYFSIYNLPFSVAQSNAELIRNIQNFNEKSYCDKINTFLDEIGNCEVGTSCPTLLKIIQNS